MPARIFYSYARQDAVFLTQLRKHTSLLVRKGTIAEWVDTGENAGIDWRKAIDREINRADIVVLLVSADYFASDYGQYEMERAIALSKRIVPILIRPCLWKDAPFEAFNVLPSNAEPVSSWPNQEQAYVNVVDGLRAVLDELGSPVNRSSPLHVEHRRLDAALPLEIPYGEDRALYVRVRPLDSLGLIGYLELDGSNEFVRPADVVSSSPFQFETNASSQTRMRIHIQAPTLNFQQTEMFLGVPAYGDSGVVSFAFSANKLGRHTLNVELATNDATLVSRILETVSKKLGGPGDGGGPAAPAFADVVIARIQLTVTCIVKAIAVGR